MTLMREEIDENQYTRDLKIPGKEGQRK